jgi:hypothetical protein
VRQQKLLRSNYQGKCLSPSNASKTDKTQISRINLISIYGTSTPLQFEFELSLQHNKGGAIREHALGIPRVNDIDIAVELRRKCTDNDDYRALIFKHAHEAELKGRRFNSLTEKLILAGARAYALLSFQKFINQSSGFHITEGVYCFNSNKVIFPANEE